MAVDFFTQYRRDKHTHVGAIYYLSYGDDGPIKIGYVSSFSALSERLRGIQTCCPHDLVLLATRAGSMALEYELHKRFDSKRIRGEWFARHTALMKHIAGVNRRIDCRENLPRHPRYCPKGKAA